jgi:hypothetical protein
LTNNPILPIYRSQDHAGLGFAKVLAVAVLLFTGCAPSAWSSLDLQTPKASLDIDYLPQPAGNPDERGTSGKPADRSAPVRITAPASEFIKTAHEVMLNEGRRLGTACNFYLQRVLEKSGFSRSAFKANDFHSYAEKHFSSYLVEEFKRDKSHEDSEALRAFIWSFPERTPLIAQWVRKQQSGHVAIIERAGDQLIIYQASLNKYTPRRDPTTLAALLSSGFRSHLRLYAKFVPNED